MVCIDSATKKTGLAIFDNGQLTENKLLDYSYDKNMDSRFKKMSNAIIDYLCNLDPDIIYIEETVVNRNVAVQRFLTRLQGVVYGYCIMNDCEFNVIRPSEWRKLAGLDQSKNKREELKKSAIEMVAKEFNINVSDDVAEAILIGKAAINRFGN